MADSDLVYPARTPLQGARIWLSGALPEGADEAAVASIRRFVAGFCDRVFADGGSIVHGSHPSLRDLILDRARAFKRQTGARDRLTLVYSQWFVQHPAGDPPTPDAWREDALVYQTPAAQDDGEASRRASLRRMRDWMAARCDAVVAVGGRWWGSDRARAGVPEEFELTRSRGLPCFLLAGLGGAAEGFFQAHPGLVGRLKNGLDAEANRRIAAERDPAALVDMVADQLGRLPLVRGEALGGTSFRILALDGGGIKGTFTAAVLAQLQHNTRRNIARHFDLIAGTSTGGILAIGLGLGMAPAQMLDFYRRRGPVIFPLTSTAQRFRHRLHHLLRPKYSQERLLAELRAAYPPGKTLRDAETRLVIPAYLAASGKPCVFRTPHHRHLPSHGDLEPAQVALATAAAPTFFAAARVKGAVADTQAIDGGVWANDPTLAAMVEAVRWLSVPIDRIEVLSIGTTGSPFTAVDQGRAGVFGWAPKLVELLMNAQAGGTHQLAYDLAQGARILRIDQTLPRDLVSLDDVRRIGLLADLGVQCANDPDTLARVTERFLNGIETEDWRTAVQP